MDMTHLKRAQAEVQRLGALSTEIIDRTMQDWRTLQPLALKRKYAAVLLEMIEARVGADPYARSVLSKLDRYLEELQPWVRKEKNG